MAAVRRPRRRGADAVKVLWINPFPVFGGPHNHVLTLNEQLRSAGVSSTFLLPTEPGTAAGRLRDAGVEVAQLPLRRLRRTYDPRAQLALLVHAFDDVASIRHLMRRERIDVVVLAGLTTPHGAIAARLERLPILWQILDSNTPLPVRAALMPLVRRWADAVMFNGRALEKLHCRGRPLDQPTSVFTCPVNTDRFRPPSAAERRALRAELGIPADAPVVGTIANINPMKGIEWFIRAATRINADRPDAWFVICGETYQTHAGYRERLEQEMRASAVDPERWIVGRGIPDMYYRALDVKLITSVPASEGRTTTGPEAMACGVPVVATDVGAVREVIEHGRTGLVVPPLDAEALASGALMLLSDAGLRARLGAEARRRAVELYDATGMARLQVDVLTAARDHHVRRSAVT